MKSTIFLVLPVFIAGCLMVSGSNSRSKGVPFDGPYVQHTGGKIIVRYVMDENGAKTVAEDQFDSAGRGSIALTANTDVAGKTFSFSLKPQLSLEPSVSPDVTKLLIISDIEGNFKSFRELLQSAGVIDDSFNWIFGTGHLALTGDFFDRGDQQTEVLWLIYSLEEKAKAAGGYVHFILGNHEIMNLSGDLRYVNAKYHSSAAAMKTTYNQLYTGDTELGRWLRAKNVIEKIGHILFMHGGISAPVNRMQLQPETLNALVRPYYPDSTYAYPDPRLDTLYSDLGPFWYRQYYTGSPRATVAQLDSTLRFYGVERIATGHTVIADTISLLFNRRVINTDVPHAKGKSEALLTENGSFFRIRANGDRIAWQ